MSEYNIKVQIFFTNKLLDKIIEGILISNGLHFQWSSIILQSYENKIVLMPQTVSK